MILGGVAIIIAAYVCMGVIGYRLVDECVNIRCIYINSSRGSEGSEFKTRITRDITCITHDKVDEYIEYFTYDKYGDLKDYEKQEWFISVPFEEADAHEWHIRGF